jgi:hypothetical protein
MSMTDIVFDTIIPLYFIFILYRSAAPILYGSMMKQTKEDYTTKIKSLN